MHFLALSNPAKHGGVVSEDDNLPSAAMRDGAEECTHPPADHPRARWALPHLDAQSALPPLSFASWSGASSHSARTRWTEIAKRRVAVFSLRKVNDVAVLSRGSAMVSPGCPDRGWLLYLLRTQ